MILIYPPLFFSYFISLEEQSIQYINNYEYTNQNNLLQFEEKLRLTSSRPTLWRESPENRILIYAFRQIFHDSAVLYQNDEELYNGTAYDFDVQGIQEQLVAWNYTENGMTRILISVIPLSAKPTVKHCCFFYSSIKSQLQI